MKTCTILPSVILLVLLLPKGALLAQADTHFKKDIPILHVKPDVSPDSTKRKSTPVYFYWMFNQEYPNSQFSCSIGEFFLKSTPPNGRWNYRYLIPHDLMEWTGTSCSREKEGISNMDSLGNASRTNYFTAWPGDSISFYFSCSIGTTVDTLTGWYNFTDTVKYYLDVVDSLSGRIVQILDSTEIVPFNHQREIYGKPPRHDQFKALDDPTKDPLYFTKALEVTTDSMKLCLRVRPYFGATEPEHKANMSASVSTLSWKESASLREAYRHDNNEKEVLVTRASEIVAKYMKRYNPALARQVDISFDERIISDTLTMRFTSTTGRSYDIDIVNEDTTTVHTFETTYAFPGMEQQLTLNTSQYPKGVYLVLFRSGDTLCDIDMFIVKRWNDSFAPTRFPLTTNE